MKPVRFLNVNALSLIKPWAQPHMFSVCIPRNAQNSRPPRNCSLPLKSANTAYAVGVGLFRLTDWLVESPAARLLGSTRIRP